MSNNLFDFFQDRVGDQLVNQASSLLAEPSRNLSSAMATIVPSLVGSLIQKGGTEAGAKGLIDFLAANNFDGSLLPKVGGLLSGGASTESLLSLGATAVEYLIGDKLGPVNDLISGTSLVKASSVGNLMKMTAPLLLSILGKHIKQKELGASGVRQFLLNHRTQVLASVPPGISDLLGFANLAEFGDGGVTKGVEINRNMESIESEPKSMLSKLLPWLVLLLAALALLYFLGRGCASAKNRTEEVLESSEKTEKENTTTATPVDSESPVVKKDVGTVTSTDVSKPPVESGTGLAQLSKALEGGAVNPNTAFTLDKGEFQGISTVLTTASETELDQLVILLKAHPNTHIRIEAHTDNLGNADINMQLSTQQALAIMTYLQSRGIGLNRMTAFGRGQTKPRVSNETAAGKNQNRRIEIFVVKEN